MAMAFYWARLVSRGQQPKGERASKGKCSFQVAASVNVRRSVDR